MELRDYQKESIEKIHEAWQKYRSVMFQMPTGTGKTVIFNEIAHGERQQDNHVLIIAHRKEIVEQIVKRLESSFREPVGIIMSGYPSYPERLIQVASIQTLHRREYPNSSVIIIDEAHHATAETYRRLWEEYPNARFLGVTATPIRLNGEGFKDLFNILITSDSIDSFIKQNFLAPIKYLGHPKIIPDLRKIKDKGGDFDPDQLSREMCQEIIMANLTKSYLEFAKGKKIIVFAVDIQHSLSIVERYQKLGIMAEHIDADTKKEERNKILERFRKGQTKILSNVNIVSEGFDMPDCDGVQLARPTKSLGLYLQQIGRCMRPAKGKDYAIVLDNVGLYEIFGSPKKLRYWSLEANQNIKLETDEAINRLCTTRNRDKPSESNDLNLVILEDVEFMTIDEIKAQIQELEKAILECEKSLEKTNLEIRQQSLRKEIHEYKQKIADLEIDLQQALERASQEKFEEVVNECKEFIQMSINDASLNNNLDKIKFIDKLIEFLEKEKSKLSKLDELPSLPAIITSYPPTKITENNTSSQVIGNNYPNGKSPQTRLQVTFLKTGKVIAEHKANDTFITTIKQLGIEDCMRVCKELNLTLSRYYLVSQQKPDSNYSGRVRVENGYYFMTNTSTEKKKEYLDKIAEALRVDITVDIIEK